MSGSIWEQAHQIHRKWLLSPRNLICYVFYAVLCSAIPLFYFVNVFEGSMFSSLVSFFFGGSLAVLVLGKEAVLGATILTSILSWCAAFAHIGLSTERYEEILSYLEWKRGDEKDGQQ